MGFIVFPDELLKEKDWRNVTCWNTYDGRELSIAEMDTPHLINICRQIINEACYEEDIELIPVRTPLASIEFGQTHTRDWVLFCKVLYNEILHRMNAALPPHAALTVPNGIKVEKPLSSGYMRILQEIVNRIDLLSVRLLNESPFSESIGQSLSGHSERKLQGSLSR